MGESRAPRAQGVKPEAKPLGCVYYSVLDGGTLWGHQDVPDSLADVWRAISVQKVNGGVHCVLEDSVIEMSAAHCTLFPGGVFIFLGELRGKPRELAWVPEVGPDLAVETFELTKREGLGH